MTKRESDMLEQLLSSHEQTREWQKTVDGRLTNIEGGTSTIKRVLFGEQKEDVQISKGLIQRHQDLYERQKKDEFRWQELDKVVGVIKILTNWKTILGSLGGLIGALLFILEKLGITNLIS